MIIAEDAPAWLVTILLLLLAVAAVEDGWRLRISNLIVIAVAATGVAAMTLANVGWDAWQPLAVAAAVLAVGTVLFAMRWVGGGDIKLLAASSTWFMLDGAWKMLAVVAVVGGLLTLIALILRRFSAGDGRIALLRRGVGVPYGIAIAIGVAATVLWAR